MFGLLVFSPSLFYIIADSVGGWVWLYSLFFFLFIGKYHISEFSFSVFISLCYDMLGVGDLGYARLDCFLFSFVKGAVYCLEGRLVSVSRCKVDMRRFFLLPLFLVLGGLGTTGAGYLW